MKKRLLAGLLTLAMLFTLLPAGPVTAFAAGAEIYVSADGDDNGDGTIDSPYASLAKAVENAPDQSTIYVMSDLTMTRSARFWDVHLTIEGYEGNAYTITRGDNFGTAHDPARGYYNPAMVEAQTQGGENGAGLTLRNIIFDDAGKHEGEEFSQAVNGKDGNTSYVQDAIIASNATNDCTITLGEGAVLQNFGGMSAVRVTNKARLVMESGSKITDTMEQVRTGDNDAYKGPAGAVWLQGGVLEMEAGAEITGLDGRAVYNEGGDAVINGRISNITSNKQMWQETAGVAIHLRGGATATLGSTGVISDLSSAGSAISAQDGSDVSFTMENGSVLRDLTNMTGIAALYKGTIVMDGEITGLTGHTNQAINLQRGPMTCKIGKNGSIHDNETWYGAIYIQGDITMDVYGKINHNDNRDRGGAIAMANNIPGANVTMHDGAEIKNNTSAETGGGIMVSYGIFTMEGGEISNNQTTDKKDNGVGGGVYVRRGGTFIMNDGTISGNTSGADIGNAIAYDASDNSAYIPKVELNGGTVDGDVAITSTAFGKNDRYFKITNEVTLSDPAVYFETDSKTIEAEQTDLPIELGNASPDGITALTNAAKDKSYSSVKATFWAQTEDDTAVTIGGLTNLDAEKDILLAAVPVGADGIPEAGAKVAFFAATINADGTVSAALPKTGKNGCDFALVQPGDDPVTPIVPGSMEMTKTANVDAVENIGDEVTYTLSTNVPASLVNYLIPDESIQMFSLAPPLWGGEFPVIFHDELPAGLDLDADSIVVKVNGEPIGEDLYTVRTDSEDISELSDDCTFEIEMDLVAILNEGYFEEEKLDGEELPKIEIAYTAAYNGTAGTSLINTAWAEYANGDSNKAECTIQVPVIGGSDPAPSGGSDDSSILLPLLIGAAAVAVPIIVHHYKEKNAEVPEEVPVEEPVEEVVEETPAEVIEAEPVPKTGDTTHPVALALGGAAMLALGGALGRKRRDDEGDER